MKKIIKITIEVDKAHQVGEEWKKEKAFIEDEIDDALSQISDFTNRKYRNCSGTSKSGATRYTVSVKQKKQ
ncbi:MAG: hypothetical protein LUE98_11860 [Tannerellaceae bacterium]|nr:hypothetical protein [Tannerellaceae bacterium]